ncbi:type II toxin-antitoxin system HicB family antitoxin [Mesoaciditoga lauensis]|uniref:type II toxin-antitoxin system HicB family antitoxin n=1 Tax=Mesoaciditoga lauensis TaxID=1495039 RepID=UPI00056BB6FE|nr:2-oxoisovalerate dehydrogenase [Mesoaciditoga lauensis]
MREVPDEIIFLVEESQDGGYKARALGYSIFTQGETFDEIKKNIKDAVHCHFEEKDKPLLIRLHFVKDEIITV